MYNVKNDYRSKLREFLLYDSNLVLTEDPQHYADGYDDTILQGFLVWNLSAYVAKEYEFGDIKAVDFFIIPVFGEKNDESSCQAIQYLGLNIDMYQPIDQTGQRADMVAQEIINWHRHLITDGYLPIDLPTGEHYVILPNGATPNRPLANMPYSRITLKYKLDTLHRI